MPAGHLKPEPATGPQEALVELPGRAGSPVHAASPQPPTVSRATVAAPIRSLTPGMVSGLRYLLRPSGDPEWTDGR